MKALVPFALLCLVSCAASPEKLDTVAREEAARLVHPGRPLADFAEYVLLPMTLAPAVQEDEKKVAAAQTLQEKLNARIEPMLAEWRQAPRANRTGTVVIEPMLQELRIVSGGARFWAGAWAGDSSIDLDLRLSDSATHQELARVRIERTASAMSGGWSVGKSDQNLYDYIVAITAQYLADCHGGETAAAPATEGTR